MEYNKPIHHPEENGVHYKDGDDVSGINKHLVQGADGKKRYAVNLWPRGVIPYVIEGPFNDENYNKIVSVLNDFQEKTCLQFVERTEEENFITFVSPDKNDCSSDIGMSETNGEGQILNLHDPDCFKVSTIQHEVMHALGFHHEQTRPDRDEYVNYYPENLKDEKSERHNYDISLETFKDLRTPYDILSVMQYDSYSNAIGDTKEYRVLETKDGEEIFDAEDFSEGDIEEINLLYGCNLI